MNGTTRDGVHRLIDMVVEEVSLVDRAANNRRFLIVKRDDPMDEDAVKGMWGGGIGHGPGSWNWPLGAALAALESLTTIVELMGSAQDEGAEAKLAQLATQLRAIADQILARTGAVEAPAEPPTEPATEAAPPPAGEIAEIQASLTKLGEALHTIAKTVRDQQQRLGRVEKQFGLPNSAAHSERVSKATPEMLGWPLDLNRPMDREIAATGGLSSRV